MRLSHISGDEERASLGVVLRKARRSCRRLDSGTHATNHGTRAIIRVKIQKSVHVPKFLE